MGEEGGRGGGAGEAGARPENGLHRCLFPEEMGSSWVIVWGTRKEVFIGRKYDREIGIERTRTIVE